MDSISSTENVRVVVRINGAVSADSKNNSKKCYEINLDKNSIIGLEDYSSYFTFDAIFDQSATQEEIFDVAVKKLCDDFNNGFNVLAFAYGQTGSGKTYTMEGFSGSDNKEGVIPRAINAICGKENTSPLRVQYIEVYNDEIADLIQVNGGGGGSITLRSDSNGNNILLGAREAACASPAEIMGLFRAGSKKRSTSATRANDTSSRSHAIFIIIGAANNTFHFVDLAGSERAKKTGAQGQQLREGIEINKGLLALGNVISSLSANGAISTKSPSPHSHIPYRDSKLTRILQRALGGDSKTLMITCISTDLENYPETINSLRYSNRAKNIQNKAVAASTNNGNNGTISVADIEELRIQMVEMKTAHEKEVSKMREDLDYNLRERERLRLCLDHKFEEVESLMDERDRTRDSYEKYIAELKALFAYTKNLPDSATLTPKSSRSSSESANVTASSSEDVEALKEEIYLLRMLRQQDMQRIDSLLVNSQPLQIHIPPPMISHSSSLECLVDASNNNCNINNNNDLNTSSTGGSYSNDENYSHTMTKSPSEPSYSSYKTRTGVVSTSISKVFKKISCFSSSRAKNKTGNTSAATKGLRVSAYDEDIDITQELIISKLKLAEQDMENENLKHEFRRLEEMFVELKSEVVFSRSSRSSSSGLTNSSVSFDDDVAVINSSEQLQDPT